MKREKPLFRLLAYVVSRAHWLSVILIVASVGGLLALPLLDRPIKFDEKGLLAGLAHPTIGAAAASLLPAASRIAAAATSPTTFQRPGSAAALAEELRRAGLTATLLTHATVLADPATRPPGTPPALCRCSNVHTLVRSARGDGTESLALVTPVAFSPPRQPGPSAPHGAPADPSANATSRDSDQPHLQTADAAELALLTGASLALHLARGPPPGTIRGVGGGAAAGGAVGSTGRWLARDLLWVIPDLTCGPHQCLDAWVRLYHGLGDASSLAGSGSNRGQGQGSGERRCGVIAFNASAPPPEKATGTSVADCAVGAGVGMLRGGVIQQAVVLEALVGASSYEVPELLVIGHEGLLPKLDMFYLLRYLFNYPVSTQLWRSHHVTAAQQAATAWLRHLLPAELAAAASVQDYLQRLLTGLHFAWHQAVGRPTGAHAAFKDSMVDAATVRLVKRSPSRPRPSPTLSSPTPDNPSLALALAASLELTLRSLNNLVERVHHSSFLYVLTGLDRFVSVERYVGPAVALAAVLQLQAAWSMLKASQALASNPRISPARTWATAAARATARTATLAAAAAVLRALACQPLSPPALGCDILAAGADTEGTCPGGPSGSFPGWPGAAGAAWAAAAAAFQGLLASPLASQWGVLVEGGLALLVAGGAAAAAKLAGRLASAGVGDNDDGPVGQGTGAREGAGGSTGEAPPQGDAGQVVNGKGFRGRASCKGGLCSDDTEWHAERTVVLTSVAAAMAALVCLNWAAAVVAGAYMVPLALGQGVAAARATELAARARESRSVQGHGGGFMVLLRMAAWLAAAPFLLIFTADAAALGAVAEGSPVMLSNGTVGSGICGLSPVNYWYAYIVASSLWLFGATGSLT